MECLIRIAKNETEASFAKTSLSSPTWTLPGRRKEHNPWAECPTCKCPYEGETQQKLASSMWKRYGDASAGGNTTKKRTCTIPTALQKLTLWTVAKAKASSGALEEAIKFSQQLLEIEKEEQKIYSGRRCTAFENNVVTQEAEALCIIGESYLGLDDFSRSCTTLFDAMDLAKMSGGELYARILRLLSSANLAFGETIEALRCIELAVDTMRNLPTCERRNELEFLQCMWVSGVVHCAVGSTDKGLNELNDALVGASHSLGENYSIVRRWRSEIQQYRSLYNGANSVSKGEKGICSDKSGDLDLDRKQDCELAQ